MIFSKIAAELPCPTGEAGKLDQKERQLVGGWEVLTDDQHWGALLPDGFAQSEWLVLAEAAVRSPIGEQPILVASCRASLS